MINYMGDHEKLLNHKTIYVDIFNKLGVFLQQGYIDEQLQIHQNNNEESDFDSKKVMPILKRLVTQEDFPQTSYVFCANSILSPSFQTGIIQGMNKSLYMKYPGLVATRLTATSGVLANVNRLCLS